MGTSDQNSAAEKQAELLRAVSAEPLDAALHLRYAQAAFANNHHFLAFAELKTAAHLGADAESIDPYRRTFRDALPELTAISHNQYFRFRALADAVSAKGDPAGLSILDVGGGQGQLAAFLPDTDYCLAEPGVNGISGIDLPFAEHTFDYVVSCHVLEHIPVPDRDRFLDQLLSASRRGVILLNPFHIEGTHVTERIQLVIDITGADWAREHLECSLPRVEDIQRYADERGLDISIAPNGTLTTSMAFVFVDHFASKSGLRDEWRQINRFFNEHFGPILDSPDYPNSYLIHLSRPSPA